MAQWFGRRTLNPEVAGSNPALTTKLGLFLGRPLFNSPVPLVNSQLVCLPPVGIFNYVMFICIFVSSFGFPGPEKPHWGSAQLRYLL